MKELITEAAELIKNSKNIYVFTGAGISVESGIPCFTGKDGLWNKYNPIFLEIDYYLNYSDKAWPAVKAIFYDEFMKAKPNEAHNILAKWEKEGIVRGIITQNIDSLHYIAGSKNVVEFHGSRTFICMNEECRIVYSLQDVELLDLVPRCKECGEILKPNFVFYGDPIAPDAYDKAMEMSRKADLFIIIGTAGEVSPANIMPTIAKHGSFKIIEINTEKSKYTDSITDVFLNGKAGITLKELDKILSNN